MSPTDDDARLRGCRKGFATLITAGRIRLDARLAKPIDREELVRAIVSPGSAGS